ncbi:hypothetical protein [Embleya scabrispora]|uniref:hypothetical protein n=1 Tax=Embleya scabrispora TaxID=159449 RepID=UPI0003998808|nr:hypothetical protein [Embleya scabrispora]MYS85175.1 hypothetical protein [Streptomyces sp. SID5474]
MNAKRTAAVPTASGLLLTVGAAGTVGAAPASTPAAVAGMPPGSGLGMFGHVVNAPKAHPQRAQRRFQEARFAAQRATTSKSPAR